MIWSTRKQNFEGWRTKERTRRR